MKFEDLLMQPSKHEKIKDLEEDVEILRQDLQGELHLKNALQCALQGPSVHSCPCVSSLLLPNKVQKLLKQVAMVEEEVVCLERKVYALKLNLHQEHEQTKQREMLYHKEVKPLLGKYHKKQSVPKQKNPTDSGQQHGKHRFFRGRRASASSGSSTEICSLSFNSSYVFAEETAKAPRHSISCGKDIELEIQMKTEKPNRVSEELLTCLIGIYLKLNQKSFETEAESSSIAPKHTLLSLKSKSFIPKTSFRCATLPMSLDKIASCVDAYETSRDLDGTMRDVGPYMNYLQITQSSIHKRRLSQCLPALKNLRDLLDELTNVDPTYLTYKQKLAFWINIFNASIMHAFLRLGFPSTQDKLLLVMNETAINIGGVVMNAMAIENFILGHPSGSQWGMPEEKEMLGRAYGLGYPEPNVIFALCRGSWSSPALRVYKPEEIVNQLEKAKLEYLEAAVVVTNKKKILLPKLMQWHMRDFADDMELLMEWIYSQLPHSAPLKGLIMECLNADKKTPITKMIEIQPYNFAFRYILFLQSETKQFLDEQQTAKHQR